MDNHPFKVGDVVKDQDGTLMTIEETITLERIPPSYKVNCIWFEGTNLKRRRYDVSELKLMERK